MHVVLGNVDMLEQPLPPELMLTFGMSNGQTEILIEVECDDIAKTQPLFLVESHQFTVNGQRSGSRR
mgnify:CR=1 FL=1